MRRSLFAFAALSLLALPSASRALDCPAPEKKGQTPGGYSICKPSATGQCGPGRKYGRHARELTPLCEDDSAPKAKAPAAAPTATNSPCAAGEERTTFKGYEVCKPVGGACGKGRKNQMHHRYQDLIVCVDDKSGHNSEVTITCSEHERPHVPASKRIKPFCEPVGRCGFGRVAVASDVPGKQMCIPK